MSSPDILAEIVGSSGKSAELFEEIQDVATKPVSTQEVNEQQFAQGTILEQRIIKLESRIEAEESQYIAIEKVWEDNQNRQALVISILNDRIAHLQNYSATDSITPRVSNKTAKFERVPDMQTKLVFYTTKLKGAANDLIGHALEEDGSVNMTDVQEFTEILKIFYTDVDAAETAATELRALQQREKETIALFIAKFKP
ncbi:hypothetical protein BJ878DRAFT_546874 [Calycina marina]|uniref:Uncharacterized protein n=1 Tax=Calycina marina TaxID=1763456 RepID=A0A9P7YTV0_9HELO|nr:hypothetical protein BJ878DRAFT_546874 [Calycina marina]